MKPMPDADEHRRLGKVEAEKAHELPAGRAKEVHWKKAPASASMIRLQTPARRQRTKRF